MKLYRTITALLSIAALLCSVTQAHAAQTNADTCQEQVNIEMIRAHRLFRSVIFGLKEAEKAQVGEVRYDMNENVWYKAAEGEWRSAAEGFESVTWSDTLMDSQSQVPPRKGLLETKRVTTSEIVPYIGQSLRALQCHVDLLCDAVRQSIEQTGSSPRNITARAYGCLERDVQTLPMCHFFKDNRKAITDRSDAELYCEEIGKQMLEQEAAIMELAVQYDSGYRSMLQIAGSFDLFLQEFRSPIVNSLRQMVNMVGSFTRIPCFLSSCDGSPPNDSP